MKATDQVLFFVLSLVAFSWLSFSITGVLLNSFGYF